MKNNELKKLIIKIANKQDKSAFSDIFDYFAPKIIGYLVGLGSQRETAEEITQDVLSIVWQKSPQLILQSTHCQTCPRRILQCPILQAIHCPKCSQ